MSITASITTPALCRIANVEEVTLFTPMCVWPHVVVPASDVLIDMTGGGASLPPSLFLPLAPSFHTFAVLALC